MTVGGGREKQVILIAPSIVYSVLEYTYIPKYSVCLYQGRS